jgi:DHA1 family tetracycline resistance protein-like MFS transporter
MTRHVGASQYGELQGATGAVMGMATMIGPTMFATTFAHFISEETRFQLPGAAFLLASVLLVTALLLAAAVTSGNRA